MLSDTVALCLFVYIKFNFKAKSTLKSWSGTTEKLRTLIVHEVDNIRTCTIATVVEWYSCATGSEHQTSIATVENLTTNKGHGYDNIKDLLCATNLQKNEKWITHNWYKALPNIWPLPVVLQWVVRVLWCNRHGNRVTIPWDTRLPRHQYKFLLDT